MLVVLHVFIALSSLSYSTALFVSPAKSRFSIAYGLVGLTLGSGTYLVVSSGAHMIQACMSGLLYLGFVSALIVAAHRKFAKENA